jgi:hypothetical protein
MAAMCLLPVSKLDTQWGALGQGANCVLALLFIGALLQAVSALTPMTIKKRNMCALLCAL